MGAGKTSAAMHLSSKYEFQYTRYSAVLQEWLRAEVHDKDQLQRLGWDIMSGGRQHELNSRLLAGLDHSRSAVIDGLRHPIDFESLSSAFGSSFRLIFLDVRPEVRFERLRSRFANYSTFKAADSHPVDAHIDELQPLASMTISNNDSLTDVYKRLDELVTESRRGKGK